MLGRTKVTMGVVVGIALSSVAWIAGTADEPPKRIDQSVRLFMRQKLDASTKILEGLTTDNFSLIRDGAKSFQSMSAAEKWRVTNDALYRQYSQEFRQHADKLQEMASAKNLDGATLAWIECTMSCVRCHTHARTIRIAKD